ncbi:MAG: hypothetical protein CBE00_05030 [Planctomycetaceae bacterium TMED240]|nr:hypothetical protein [Rhodopirellula sp.]OUX07408.1 MAG: hypothetical protein CBE00_05030 [Planctomycetaceae bacterium TMED240]
MKHVPTTWNRTGFILFEDLGVLKQITGIERLIKAPEMLAFPVSRPKQAPFSRATGDQRLKHLFFPYQRRKTQKSEEFPQDEALNGKHCPFGDFRIPQLYH